MAWQVENSGKDAVDMEGKDCVESDVVVADFDVWAGVVGCAGASAK
jgi:hypothetical protein